MSLPLIGLLGFVEGWGKETAAMEKERMVEEAQAKRDQTLHEQGLARDAARVKAEEDAKRRERYDLEAEAKARRQSVIADLEKYRSEGISVSDSDIVRDIRNRKGPMDIVGTGPTGDSVNLRGIDPSIVASQYEDASTTPEIKGIIAKSIGVEGGKRAPTEAEVDRKRLELQENAGLISAADATRSRDTRAEHKADRDQRAQQQVEQFAHIEAMQKLTNDRIKEEAQLGRDQQDQHHRERMQLMRDQLAASGLHAYSDEKGAWVADLKTGKAKPITDETGKQIKTLKDDDSFKLIDTMTRAAKEANAAGDPETAKKFTDIAKKALDLHMKTHGGGEAPKTPTKPIGAYDSDGKGDSNKEKPKPKPQPAAETKPAAAPSRSGIVEREVASGSVGLDEHGNPLSSAGSNPSSQGFWWDDAAEAKDPELRRLRVLTTMNDKNAATKARIDYINRLNAIRKG